MKLDVLLIIILFAIPMISQFIMFFYHGVYKVIYNKVEKNGIDSINIILNNNNVEFISVNVIDRELSDEYVSSLNKIRLSDEVYNKKSIYSLAIGAFEATKAILDREAYFMLKFKNTLMPIIRISTAIFWGLFLISLLWSLQRMYLVSLVFLYLSLLIYLMFLPVEFKTSKKALSFLHEYNLLTAEELKDYKKVLFAKSIYSVSDILRTPLSFCSKFVKRR